MKNILFYKKNVSFYVMRTMFEICFPSRNVTRFQEASFLGCEW